MGDYPGSTYDTQSLTDGSTVGVNPVNGNLELSSTDLDVPGVNGFDAKVGRYYNNLSSDQDSFGLGWSMGPGADSMLAIPFDGQTSIGYFDGTGSSQMFTMTPASNGTEVSPPGLNATLTMSVFDDGFDSTSFTLTFANGLVETFTGPVGGNKLDRLASMSDGQGDTITYSYNSSGQLTSLTDTHGNTTTFSYSSAGYISQITAPDGSSSHYYQNSAGQLTSYVNPQGQTTSYAYDSYGNLTQIQTPDGKVLKVSYDAGNTNAVQQIEQLANSGAQSGPTTSYTYANGSACSSENGYDPGWLQGTATYPDGNRTSWCLNDLGALGAMLYSPPANTAAPTVSGTAQDGSTLTTSNGTWSGTPAPTFGYQWERCDSTGANCTSITGATASTYTLTSADVGSTIEAQLTATNQGGTSNATSSPTSVIQPLAPANTTAPTITGTPTDGATLSASAGAWTGTTPLSYSYQWQDCNTSGGSCTNISAATSSTYTLTSADIGDTIVVKVTASNTAGNATASSAATGVVQSAAPVNSSPPAITGTTTQGSTLTASQGTWSGTTPISYSYQWQSCDPTGSQCANITGATTTTYQPQPGDIGSTLKVTVTASNTEGTAAATSGPTGIIDPASGPACTDAWIGASGSAWETAANWSNGSAPTSSDIACMRQGSQATVTGPDDAGELQAPDATATINSGQLALHLSADSSTLGTLNLNAGELSTNEPLTLETSLTWTGGTLGGAGTITLATSTTSTITPTSSTDNPTLDTATLQNQGTMTLDCANPTGTLGASVLVGQNGAVLNNATSGTLNLGTSSGSQLCALEQGEGTAAELSNAGTLNAPDDDFVGWQLDNASAGTVRIGSYLGLAGGEGPSAEAGTWNGAGATLSLMAGSYDLADPTSVNLGALSIGIGQNGVADSDPLDGLISGTPSPANVIVPAASWPNTVLLQWSGTVSLGTSAAPSDFQFVQNFGGSLTLTSPPSQPTTTSYLGVFSGSATLYGETQPNFVQVGGVGLSGPYPAASLYQEGTLVLTTNGLEVDAPSVVHQDGTLELIAGYPGAEEDPQIAAWHASPQYPTIEGTGTTIYEDYNPEPSTCGPAGLQSGVIVEQQAIVNESAGCGLAVYGDPALLDGATLENNGLMTVYDGITAGAGSSLTNNATLDALGALFATAPGAGSPELINNPGGQLAAVGTMYVNWQTTNNGSVSGTWIFDPTSSSTYGANNPATPYAVHPQCGTGVGCATGNLTEQQTDMSFSGLGGLSLTRTYNSQLAASQLQPGMFGYGWTSSFEAHLWLDSNTGAATVQQPDGSTASFTPGSGGSFVPAAGVEATLTQEANGEFDYVEPDQDVYIFSASGQIVSQTNLVGMTTSYSYNDAGQLTAVTAASGRHFTFTYNPQGLVATATDPAGLIVSYSYDSADDLTAVSDSAGPATTRWQFTYDGAHELTTLTDADGNTTTIAYSAGQAVSETDPLGHIESLSYAPGETLDTAPAGGVTQYMFNSQDEPIATTQGYGAPDQTTTTSTYNAAGEPTSVTDGNNNATTYGYDSAGNQTSLTTPDQQTTSSTYDGNRDLTGTTLPSGVQTSYVYNTQGLPTSETQSGPGGLSETTSSTYNASGELTSHTDARGYTTTYTYDSYGDIASQTDPLGNETTYSYDADGRQTAVVAPAGNVSGGDPFAHMTTYTYDALGDITSETDPLGDVTSYTYDGNQNKLSETDPDGHTTTYTYGADGELTKTTLPDASTQTTSYDADGNVLSQTNGDGDTTTYTYTPLDQLASVTDPLGNKTSYTYDSDGNVATTTDPIGRVTTDGYNKEDELTSISYSDGTTPNVTYTYNADGLRTSMTDGTGTTTYDYDGLDRLTSTTNGDGQTLSYSYDADNDITSVGYPNSQTVTRAFDNADRLQSVTDWLGNTTTFAYDGDGNLTTTTYPAASGNVDSYSYNNADELTGAQMMQGSSTLATLGYRLDPAGLVTTESQTGLPGAASTAYTYTPNEQLATAGSLNYSYDNAYNLTQLDSQTGYTYNTNSELTSSPAGSYGYDSLGERISATPTGASATGYSYDQAGRLISVTPPGGTQSSYMYDGDGNLTTVTAAGSTNHLAWDTTGSLPLLLTDGASSYIYGPDDQPFEQITTAGTASYLHADQIGSTRLITNSTGGVAGTFTYNPYGSLAASTGTATTPFRYAGQYTDPNTGLIYMQARWYDPNSGQFLTVDPALESTWQEYAYAGDEPLRETDPTGLCGNPFAGWGGFWANCGSDIVHGLVAAGKWVWNHKVPIAETVGIVALGVLTDGAGDLALESEVESSTYVDITTGSSIRNIGTDATETEFRESLFKNGWKSTMSGDGRAEIFTKNGAKYALSEGHSSWSGWTADYTPEGGKMSLKIRLGYP